MSSSKGLKKRPIGKRRYKRIFLIVTEGERTELQYFDFLKRHLEHLQVTVVTSKKKSSPKGVLKCAKTKASKMGMRKGDEVWLVIDRDNWTDEQIDEVLLECNKKKNYHLAVSNPQFEYWLLLHFESGCGICTSNECMVALRKHLQNYEKSNIDMTKLEHNIPTAIDNAKRRDNPPTPDWPKDPGCTTVYRLVERLLPPPVQSS